MDLFRQRKGIDQTVLTGRPLTGDDGPDALARAARMQSVRGKEIDERLDILILDPLDLQRQPHRHRDDARAVFFARLCNDAMLLRRDLSVFGDDARIEHVGIALVLQEPHAFDPLDLLGRNRIFHLISFPGASRPYLDMFIVPYHAGKVNSKSNTAGTEKDRPEQAV